MTNTLNRCQRRIASWTTLLTFTASSLCFAQVPTGTGEQPAQMSIHSEETPDARPVMPRSRSVLTAEEFSALVGQTLSLSVRTRWPRRVVKGTVVAVDSDTVRVDAGKGNHVTIASSTGLDRLPIASSVILSRSPARHRRRAAIATITTLIGGHIWVAVKCRRGGC